MKFDHIIMNPPYSGSLHLKILREAMKHSDDIVNLSPIRWLQDPLVELKENHDFIKYGALLDHVESIDIIDGYTAWRMFNAAFGFDLGVYHIVQSKTFKHIDLVNPLARKLVALLSKYTTISLAVSSDKAYKINLPEIHGHVGCKDWFEVTSKDYNSALKVSENKIKHLQLSFDTENERHNFYNSLFTKFYKFCIGNFRSNINVTGLFRILPFLPDYTHPWTDQMLYEYFGLTEDEIKTIEKEI